MALGGFMMGRPGGSTPNKNLASSTREGGFASGGGGMSNGTTRNNTFGGQTARAEPGGIGGGGGGLASPNVSRGATLASDRMVNRSAKSDRPQLVSPNVSRGGVLASERMVNRSTKGNRLQSVNIGAKGDYLGFDLGSDAVNRSAKTPRSITQAYGSRTAEIKASDNNILTSIADKITAAGVRGIGITTPKSSTGPVPRGVQPKASTGPVSRGIQPKASTGPVARGQQSPMSTPSARMTGIQDYKSIVPGKVTMAAEMVPFAQKNPKLAKYMGGTPAKPINVSVEEARKMAKSVVEVGAYVSGASPLAKGALDEKALKQLGTVKKGYGTTTVQAGKGLFSGTIDVSYPKSVATDKSFGTYTAGPLSSSGPVSRGVQPKASTGPVSRGVQPVSRMSTGPVPRGVSPAPKSSTGPVSRGMQTSREVAKPTVQQVRIQSKENKAASVKSRIVKGGYVYNRVGDRLQNFTAESDVISRDRNRMRRNQK